MTYFIVIITLLYFVYTLNFAIKFNKTDTYFTYKQRLFQNLLIWLIPFFWIMVIKTITKPTPGSSKYKKRKSDSGFYESGIGILGQNEAHHHASHGGHADVSDD